MIKKIDRDLSLLKNYRETEEALSMTIKIGWREVLQIVVKDLIAKRNSPTNKIIDSFDAVLKFYLTEDEFKKYVIDKKELQ